MSFYKDTQCPVCHKTFEDGDDIVTCPICGTPHHRECYEKLGHCANSNLHAESFNFRRSMNESKAQKEEQKTEDTEIPKSSSSQQKKDNKTVCAYCGSEIEKGTPFCNKCGARQMSADAYKPSIYYDASNVNRQYNSVNVIDGEATEDVIAVIRTNVNYFLPKFINNKKASWNWGALFFGPFYLIFRKMYKQGAIFMVLQYALSLIVQGVFSKPLQALSDFVSANYSSLMKGTATPSEKLINNALPAIIIILAIYLVINIFISIFANSMYRNKVMNILKNVDDKLTSGGMFEQTPMLEQEMNLSQDDMRKIYLSKIGGTSILAPILAYFIFDLLSTFIASII